MLIRILFLLAMLVAGTIGVAYLYTRLLWDEPALVSPDRRDLPGVGVQPAEAIALAEPYLSAHGTESRREDEPLKTYVARFKGWYYVKRTNYPAKTAGYFLHSAVKVHEQTGEVGFSAE